MNLFSLQNATLIRFGRSLIRGLLTLFVSVALALFTYTLVRAAPNITVTLTDIFIGGDGDGKADPGETIEYTAVITNSGADPATGVTFNDVLDLNTTVVDGSLNVSPLAGDDAYEAIGNTLLEVGVTASGNPAVAVAGGLFSNDIEFLTDTFTLKSVEADAAAPFTNVATEQGGSVTVESDGAFSYIPAVGFSGTDNFDYVITDDGSDGIPGNADDMTGAGRVTITVNAQRVWYVKNDAAPGGSGRSSDPFDTLAEAQTASAANDTIYVFAGNGTTAGQSLGIALKAGQRLLGEGVALTVPVVVNGGPNPTTLKAAGSQPQIDNTTGGGNGVSVTDISGVEIRGLNIAGSANAIDVTTTGANSGSFEIANNTIRSAGVEGIDVNGGGSGTLTVSIHDNTVTATGNGIDVARSAGSVVVTAFDDNNVSGNTGGIGINVVGSGATILFDANPGTAAFDAVSGGATVVGQSGNGVGASGFVLNNVRGDLSFTDLDIYSTVTALSVNGTSPNYTGTSGTRVTVTASVSTLSATGGAAADITDANVNLVLSSLTSTNSAGAGVSLTRVSGTFTGPAGSAITNASGADVSINGGSNASANVAFTYGGTITDDLGTLVQIQNVTATSAHSFTGAITDGNDGDGSGISLTGNSGATISFSGGLLLSTGANPAFTATGGGTVNVCDENPCNPAATGASVNTLTTTTGTALNIVNTTIGANDLEFRSISANGAANGIVLNNTGSSGNLAVKGNGGSCTSAGSCTGGAIQSTTGDGISLTSATGVSLTRLFVGGSGNHGINTSAINGLTLTNAYITNSGNGDNEHGLNLVNVQGTITIDGTAFDNASEDLVHLDNTNANATLTVTNSSSFSYPTSVGGFANSAFLILPSGASAITASIQNSTFTNIKNLSAQISANALGSSGTQIFTFSNNTINVTLPGRASGVFVGGQEATRTDFTIANNTFSGAGGNGVLSFDTNDTATIRGTASNNVITNPPGIGIFVAVDEAGKSDVTLNGNTITNSGGDGIQTVNFGGVGVSNMDMTITNNQVNGHSLNTSVNFVGGMSFTTFEDNSCVVLRGNTVIGTPASPTQCGGAPCVDYYLEEVGGTGTMEEVPNTGSTTADAAYVNSINDAGPVTVFGAIDLTNGGTCNVTGLGMEPLSNPTLANAETESESVAFDDRTLAKETSETELAVSQNESLANTATKTINTIRHADVLRNAAHNRFAAISGGKPLFAPVRPAPALSGETVTVPAFTLPAGKSVTIKYRATVNSPLPQNATKITTQATVSGTNFSAVTTTNGGTVDCESGGETCTPIDLVDLTAGKSNGAGGTVTLGASFDWDLTITNVAASRDAIFTNGQDVLEDHLPAGPTYGTPGILYDAGVTGSMICSITSNVLTCTADASGLTIPSGKQVTVSWQVTPNAGGSLVNPTGGVCAADPNAVFAEVGIANNSCADTVTVTRPNTTVASINRQTPSGATTNASSVTWRVTFADAVSGVTTGNFTLTDVTSSITGETISTAVAVGGAPALQWDVTVNTGSGDGTLRLDIANDTGMSYALTNAPYTSGQTYAIDKTAPTVSSIVRQSPVSNPTNADLLVFRVTFNEAVTSVGAGSFVVNGTTTTITSVGSVTPNLVFDFTLDGGVNGNLSNLNGAVGLDISASPIITDLAGNTLQVVEPMPAATNDQTYDVDNAGPSATNFNRLNPSTTTTNADTLVFQVIFSESVTGVSADGSDFTVPALTGETISVSPVSATVYDVTVSGGNLPNFNGLVDLDFAASPTITDLIGNALTNTVVGIDQQYVMDNSVPTVTNITSSAADGAYSIGAGISIQVEFSEAVTVTGMPQLTLETGATDRVVNYTGGSGSNTLTFDYTVQAGDTSNDLDYTGPTALALNGGGIQDSLTNDADLTLPTPGNSGSLGVNKNIEIDTTAPSAPVVLVPSNGSATTDATPTVSGTAEPNSDIEIFIDGSSNGSASANGSGDWSYTVPSALSQGSHTVRARSTDAAGNTSVDSNTNTFIIDTTAPDTTITNNPFPGGFTNSTTATFDFTGNDGAGVGGLTFECNLDGAGFSACSTPKNYPGPLADGPHTFIVRAKDSLGNTDATPASYAWTVDTSTPSVVVSVTANPTNASPVTVTITFSEDVIGFAPTAASGDIVIGGVGGTDANPQMVGAHTFTFDLTPGGQGTVTVQVPSAKAQDAALNNNTASNTLGIVYDTAAPAVAINQASGQTDPAHSSPINFTAVFTEPVTGFTGSDLTLGGTANPTAAIVTQVAPMDGTTYNVAVSGMNATGTVTASIQLGKLTDLAGNPNVASTSGDGTVNYIHAEPPVIAEGVSVGVTMSEDGSPIPFALTLHASDPNGGPLTWSILTQASHGAASAAAGPSNASAISYTPNSHYSGSDSFVVKVTDGALNDTITVNLTIQPIQPNVTINKAASQSDPTSASPISFTAVFSEPVTGFTGADVTLSGTAGATTAAVTGGPTTYTVKVSGMTGAGSVRAAIGANKVQDTSGSGNTASTSTDNQVMYQPDSEAPDTFIYSRPDALTTSQDASFTFGGIDNATFSGDLTFECKMDAAAYGPCASPKNYSGLSVGTHTFRVRAKDAAGNTDPTPASYTWTIVSAPAVSVTNASCTASTVASGILNLKITDADGDPLTVTLASNTNPSLVSNADIRIEGVGNLRAIFITAAAGKAGSARITFAVNDGVTSTPLVINFKVGTDSNDLINGTTGVDMLFGMGGDDTLNGAGGSDLICGGADDDLLNGGAGNDYLNGEAGTDTLNGSTGNDFLRGMGGDDTLNGEAGNDILNGENGVDTLNGGTGNDTLRGHGGIDTLTGGLGADFFSGGPALDTLIDFTPSEGDVKDLSSP